MFRAGEKSDKTDRGNIMDLLSQSGIFGLCIPEKHEGSNYDYMMFHRIVEIMSENIDYTLNVLNPQVLATQVLILYRGIIPYHLSGIALRR